MEEAAPPLVGGPSAAAHACELRTPVRWMWRRTGAVHESAVGAREREQGGLRWRGPAAAHARTHACAAASFALSVSRPVAEKQASEGRHPPPPPHRRRAGDCARARRSAIRYWVRRTSHRGCRGRRCGRGPLLLWPNPSFRTTGMEGSSERGVGDGEVRTRLPVCHANRASVPALTARGRSNTTGSARPRGAHDA